MKTRAHEIIDKVRTSDHLSIEDKSAMMVKLKEWKEDEHAAEDVVTYFDTLWLKLEPFFAELGLI